MLGSDQSLEDGETSGASMEAMTRKELMALWPRNGSDREAAERLASLNRDLLTPIVPDMVEWLKSSGSVREVFGQCLSVFNADAVKPIRNALRGTHEDRTVYILRFVLPQWSKDSILLFSDEIERLLQVGSLQGVNIHALSLLQIAEVPTHAPIEEWANFFRQRLNEQVVALDRIEASFVRRVD